MNTNQKISLKELKTAAFQFDSIRKKIERGIATLNPVELVTPVNLSAAKDAWVEKVVSDQVFDNPIFAYDQKVLVSALAQGIKLNALLKELDKFSLDKSNLASVFIWEQLREALTDGITTTKLAKSIMESDDLLSKHYVLEKYGTPSGDSASEAITIALNNSARGSLITKSAKTFNLAEEDEKLLKDAKLKAKEISEMFSWTMSQYELGNWPIEILENCSAIDVRDKSSFGHPIIAIPVTREVSGMKLAELIGHEIECHWRSSVNIATIGGLKADDELVYEGLAALKDKKFNREYLGTFNLNSAYYVVAMNEALAGHDFSHVSKMIYSYLPEKLSVENRAKKAWTYTYRVFRGISDTRNSDGYAFTKDRAYFEGWNYAKKLEERGLADYLSFSSFSQKTFEKFMALTDIEDVKPNCRLDLCLQQKALEKMIKCLKYGSTQASSLVQKL